MKNTSLKVANQGLKKLSFILLLATALMMFATDVFAQNLYDIQLRQRRLGNQIGVEVWIRSLSSSAPNLGNMTIAVTYNTSNLEPADPTTYDASVTDSVDYDVNQTAPLPYRQITSPFHNANGYQALGLQAANLGGIYVYQLDVKTATSGTGYQPATTGRGTFVGILKFNIVNYNSLTNTTPTNISVNTSTLVGDFKIYDYNGVDRESQTTIQSTPAFTIRGITILNPNGPNETVHRYKQYPSITPMGYPIYFERSGLVSGETNAEYGTNVLAYAIDYSTDGGVTWSSEVIRFAETREDLATLIANSIDGNHKGTNSEISTSTGNNNGYLVTQGDGSQLPVVTQPGYGGILRIIWSPSQYFAPRSEQARLRIWQLDTTGNNSSIDSRTKPSAFPKDTSDYNFVLSRLFFLQLNGTTNYLRTRDNYSNSTQLTVEAWVNLNSYQTAQGAEPGIVVTSPGPSDVNTEGAWMLYLHQGRYPAFRAREIIGGPGRGQNGGPYIATVISPEALGTTSDASPIEQNSAHPDNWHHIAATVSNDTVSLYVDGELMDRYINKNAINIRMATFSHPIWVGVNPNGGFRSYNYLHAGIKEVRVWRKALSQDEIRKIIPGLYNPTDTVNANWKSALELYYDFVATYNDKATLTIQNGTNPINMYNSESIFASADNTSMRFRPDRAHIRLTSPSKGAGVCNLEGQAFEVRWAGYGLGDYSVSSSTDLVLEFLRADGNMWVTAIDNTTPGNLLNNLDIETGRAYWEPYKHQTVVGQHDDLAGLVPTSTNYAKNVLMRIRGTSANGQNNIYGVTDTFVVAPYFALENKGNSIIAMPGETGMNLSVGTGFIEAWIQPYRVPTTYFPIICKKDSASNTVHYALRLLNTGQLQFVITDANGTVRTATSDATKPVYFPSQIEMDTAWTHVGVFYNFANGSGQSTVVFYIDGNAQSTDTLITYQLGTNVTTNTNNTYPVFLLYEPAATPGQGVHFIGAIKEVRVWTGTPAGKSYSGSEPTDLTKFIRGALTVRANELLTTPTDYTANLVAAFTLNGGSLVYNDYAYNAVVPDVASSSFTTPLYGKIVRSDYLRYKGVEPYIKLVEPVFKQLVPNSTTNLTVRWVGFDYDRNLFRTGDNILLQTSDMEFSTYGGGNDVTKPYNFTSSKFDVSTWTNSLSLPSTDAYRFPGTNPPYSQFAGSLNVNTAEADENQDGVRNDQGPISATLTNARLRLMGRTTINTPGPYEYTDYKYLRTESPLFTITPPSNFVVRVLLEGFHNGSTLAMHGTLGNSYETNGLRIKLYTNNGGKPGTLVATAVSTQGYSQTDPLGSPQIRGFDGSLFANVPFVFDSVGDGRYWLVVENRNHLPIMSRYPVPFYFDGGANDIESEWDITSGWDFQNWTGVTDYTLTEANAYLNPPVIDTTYTAYGYASNDKASTNYAATGLIYNDGKDETTNNPLAAMVGGDVNQDGKVDAGDRVLVNVNVGSNEYAGDVTGDGQINSDDRDIVYRNNGRVSSIGDVTFSGVQNGPSPTIIPGHYAFASEYENELYAKLVEAEKMLSEGKGNFGEYSYKIGDVLMASGMRYRVMGEARLNDGFIDVSLYIINEGEEWAPGNCTFGIDYNPNLLEYASLENTAQCLWNDKPQYGYVAPCFSAPLPITPNPLTDVRTIEIVYDSYFKPGGIPVPYTKTLIGTLRFRVKQNSDMYTFNWHRITSLHRADGKTVTNDGIFEPITPVIITKTAQIIVPNGGEQWKVKRTYTISWTKPSLNVNVYVEYSTDNGRSWIRINSTPMSAAVMKLDWVVPSVSSTECLVRLVNAETGNEIDRSDNVFAIVPAGALITRPSSADPVYSSGTKDYIRWDVEDAATIYFEFSEDGYRNWQKVTANVSSQAGQVEWTIPNVTTKNAVVAMVNAQTGQVMAVSEPFKILNGKVTFTSPTANENVQNNRYTLVRWSSQNVTNFDLQLSLDKGVNWSNIDKGVNAVKGNYSWLVPNVNSDFAIIRAIWNGDPELEYGRTPIFKIVGVVSVEEENIYAFNLEYPYPNPFSSVAKVGFTIPQAEKVYLAVYNVNGQKVADLINGVELGAGHHLAVFDADNLPSGVYYVKISAGVNSMIREVILMK